MGAKEEKESQRCKITCTAKVTIVVVVLCVAIVVPQYSDYMREKRDEVAKLKEELQAREDLVRSNLMEDRDTCRTENDRVTEELKKTEAEFTDNKKVMEDEIRKLKEALQAKERLASDYEKERDTWRNDNDRVTQELEKLKIRMNEHESTIESLKQERDDLRVSNDKLRSELDSLRQLKQTLLDDKNAEISKVQATVESLRREQDASIAEIERLKLTPKEHCHRGHGHGHRHGHGHGHGHGRRHGHKCHHRH